MADDLVVRVTLPGSKAERSGIKVGDIVVGVNGQRVTASDPEGYGEALKLATPAVFDLIRNGTYLTITLVEE